MSSAPTTPETAGGQSESEPWSDASTDRTTEFFQETIAPWRCQGCGTEFSVESVFDLNRRLGRSVSCPMCGGDNIVRRDGGGQ